MEEGTKEEEITTFYIPLDKNEVLPEYYENVQVDFITPTNQILSIVGCSWKMIKHLQYVKTMLNPENQWKEQIANGEKKYKIETLLPVTLINATRNWIEICKFIFEDKNVSIDLVPVECLSFLLFMVDYMSEENIIKIVKKRIQEIITAGYSLIKDLDPNIIIHFLDCVQYHKISIENFFQNEEISESYFLLNDIAKQFYFDEGENPKDRVNRSIEFEYYYFCFFREWQKPLSLNDVFYEQRALNVFDFSLKYLHPNFIPKVKHSSYETLKDGDSIGIHSLEKFLKNILRIAGPFEPLITNMKQNNTLWIAEQEEPLIGDKENLQTFFQNHGYCIAGGSLLCALLGNFDWKADLDFFVYGVSEDGRKIIFTKLLTEIENMARKWKRNIYFIQEASVVTIEIEGLSPNIQIIFTKYTTPFEVIGSFDMDYVMTYYDGENFRAKVEFLISLQSRCIEYLNLETYSVPYRYYKALSKGFSLKIKPECLKDIPSAKSISILFPSAKSISIICADKAIEWLKESDIVKRRLYRYYHPTQGEDKNHVLAMLNLVFITANNISTKAEDILSQFDYDGFRRGVSYLHTNCLDISDIHKIIIGSKKSSLFGFDFISFTTKDTKDVEFDIVGETPVCIAPFGIHTPPISSKKDEKINDCKLLLDLSGHIDFIETVKKFDESISNKIKRRYSIIKITYNNLLTKKTNSLGQFKYMNIKFHLSEKTKIVDIRAGKSYPLSSCIQRNPKEEFSQFINPIPKKCATRVEFTISCLSWINKEVFVPYVHADVIYIYPLNYLTNKRFIL